MEHPLAGLIKNGLRSPHYKICFCCCMKVVFLTATLQRDYKLVDMTEFNLGGVVVCESCCKIHIDSDSDSASASDSDSDSD